ncbi:GntR family transcriptional regulator [Rhodovulum sulfidophilum]|nr:GntR family transcriptional regulator [Rhodovulum sulfidophilum]MBL3583873.1 GntR family transcriptional regulator [Rhodovulum sulfidophilum]
MSGCPGRARTGEDEENAVTDRSPTPRHESRRASRARDLAEHLTRAIHERRLGPGMKLSEDEVGEIFGVSRTIVRAALQQLAHDNLVAIEPHRGAFVAQPTVREAREVFEARALVEPRTARSAALRATPQDIGLLSHHIAQEHAALAAGRSGQALRLSGQFHIEIARIADQAIIAGFIAQLISRSSLVIALYWRRPQAMCESHAHHALMRAMEDRDGDRAEEVMKGHLLDLLSLLDLHEPVPVPLTLREALTGE